MARLYKLSAPSYKLSADGVFNDPVFSERLNSLSITLNNGESSDGLAMTIHDMPAFKTGKMIEIPSDDRRIEVSMGYELKLIKMGVFYVNNVTVSGSSSGNTMEIQANPQLMGNQRNTTWNGKEISKVIDEISKDYKLKPKVSDSLKKVKVHSNQVNQADSEFLTALAESNDAVFKVMSDHLLFLTKGDSLSVSGAPLPDVKLKPVDIISWSTAISVSENFDEVIAAVSPLRGATDGVDGLEENVSVGKKGGKKAFVIKQSFADKKEAKIAAQAKLDEFYRKANTLNLTLIGNPEITAEQKIKLKGVREGIDGDWIVETTTHSFDSSGYKTTLTAYKQPE